MTRSKFRSETARLVRPTCSVNSTSPKSPARPATPGWPTAPAADGSGAAADAADGDGTGAAADAADGDGATTDAAAADGSGVAADGAAPAAGAPAPDRPAGPGPPAPFTAELRQLPGEWYVVHSYAGYENRVKANLESRTQSLNMEDYIFQIEVPVHQVIEIKGGKRQQVSEKVLPGYILVRMDLTDESW